MGHSGHNCGNLLDLQNRETRATILLGNHCVYGPIGRRTIAREGKRASVKADAQNRPIVNIELQDRSNDHSL